MAKGSGIMKDMKCSEELQAVVKEKKMSRGKVVQKLWKYIKRHDLQDPDNKRVVKCDKKLAAIFKKVIAKKRKIKMRGNVIKVPAGSIFMTEIGGGLKKHLS